MFAHIRRHQKWLMIVFAAAIIISFVIFMNPTTGMRGGGGSDGRENYGYINGRPISREEIQTVYHEVRLGFWLMAGQWPGTDEVSRRMFDPNRRVRERLLMLEKLKDLKVHVSDAAAADWIAMIFADPQTRVFRKEVYQRIVQEELPRAGLTRAFFEQFARHEAGIQYLAGLAGVTGRLLTPREAEAMYRVENDLANVEVVMFSLSNYLASVTITPEALSQFYSNNLGEYRVPEKVQVSYVGFEITNFLAEADQTLAQMPDLDQRIELVYQQRLGTGEFKDPDGKPMPAETAKQNIKDQERKRLATVAARKKAMTFAEQLYDRYEKQPDQSGHLESLAATNGFAAAVTEPFTQFDGPTDLKVPDAFAQISFALKPESPMASEPIVGDAAVYVIALKRRIPSVVEPFEAVRERVTEGFRRNEAKLAAKQAGEAFHSVLTNGFAQKKTFQTVCQEAKVTPLKPAPFALSTRALPDWDNRVDLDSLKRATLDLAPGKTSGFILSGDGGAIVHLLGRQPVDEARMQLELPAFTERLRQMRQRAAFAEWSQKEFEAANITGLPDFERVGAN